MLSSPQFSYQCRPIAHVDTLGVQLFRFDLAFSQEITNFSLSDITVWLKSKNTENRWSKVILDYFQCMDSKHLSLFVKRDIHAVETKLLHFDPIAFTQERLIPCIKIEFSKMNWHCTVLPIHCLGADDFSFHLFNDFSYSVYLPMHLEEKHPLIICLHGAGEGGYNQSNILADKLAMTFWDKTHQKLLDYPYVLAPQCPSFWLKNFMINDRTYHGERDYTDDLLKLVKQFIASHPDIDQHRVYIVGGSMGGYQGLRLLAAEPNMFAAAAIACPAQIPTDEQLRPIAHKPIWFLHSYLDQIVPVGNTQKILHTLNICGGKQLHVNYYDEVIMEERKIDPHCVFLYLYENQPQTDSLSIFEWLAQQKGGCYDE